MSDSANHNDPEPLDEVADALGLTIDVLEGAIEDLKAATSQAIQDERFDVVAADNEKIREIRSFSQDLDGLLQRWEQMTGHASTPAEDTQDGTETTEHSPKRYHGRVKRGLRTPEPDFRVPILEILSDHGGSLRASEALDRVGELMADRLTPVDFETLPHDQRTLRWRNTAQWSRNVLADEGRIDRSVRGIWTITDLGREWLESRR